jgi:MFS transporter, Spinster family, sphingosine-1-phosphate transporter
MSSTTINLLNYLDRYILAGAMEKVQETFKLDDFQGGLLAAIFIAVYTCVSPLGGFLGDRMPRKILIAISVLIWSLATMGSGLAGTVAALIIARAFTGVGEAGYGTVAPSFISDLFRKEQRSRMLAIFYTAMPFGAAIGVTLGGYFAQHFSWRHAFLIGGVPGIVLGLLALTLREPARGAMDDGPKLEPVPFKSGFRQLMGNNRFWFTTAGLMTFSVGGLSNWMPKFLSTERGFELAEASFALGVTTVVGGIFGTLAGGYLGDRLDAKRPGGGVMLSAIGLLGAVPLMIAAALIHSKWPLLISLGLAQFLIFLNNGPLNAAIANSVSPHLRAFAFGMSTLILHLLGDAASPAVIGWISKHSSLAMAILINTVPVFMAGVVLVVGIKTAWKPKPPAAAPAPPAA